MHRLSAVGLALALLTAVACDLGPCPPESDVVWADVEPIFTDHCLRCHDSSRTGSDRAGAPSGYDFDSAEVANEHPEISWSRVRTGSMPPAEPLSDADQAVLREWWACEGPE